MPRVHLLPITLLAVACSTDPGLRAPEPQLGERPDPSPYDSDIDAALAPSITSTQAASLIPQIIGSALGLDPDAIMVIYASLYARADESCPEVTTVPAEEGEGTLTFWYGGDDCVTADGTTFRGEARFSTFTTEQDGTTMSRMSLQATNMDITSTDGTYLRGTVNVSTGTGTDATGAPTYSAYFQGRVTADKLSAAGNPWLDGGLSGEVGLEAADYAGERFLYMGGTLSPPDGVLSAVRFQELVLDNFGCALNANGAVELRDLAGGWHTADFGAPPEEEDAPGPDPTCDACGDLSFAGASLGNFCGDPSTLSTFLNWETKPW